MTLGHPTRKLLRLPRALLGNATPSPPPHSPKRFGRWGLRGAKGIQPALLKGMNEMSAFIVSKTTMDHAVYAVYRKFNGSHQHPQFGGIPMAYSDDRDPYTELGQWLYRLNKMAIWQRYPDTVDNPDMMPGPVDTDDIHTNYRYPAFVDVDLPQALKSLQCLIYQCSEGNVPATDLYQALRDLEHSMMDEIIRAMPAYQQAQWDA